MKRIVISPIASSTCSEVVDKTIGKREKRLVENAGAEIIRKLRHESGFVEVAAAETQIWLEERGESLRSP